MKTIVSLTSYEARIGCVPAVFASIKAQTKQPDMVVLWLAKEQFPNGLSSLPEEVRSLHGLDIRFVDDDLKPHKKYFYVLQEFPDDLVITVDDDLILPVDAIENLIKAYALYPDCLIALRTHLMLIDENEKLLPYGMWPRQSDILIGSPSHQLFSTNGAGTLFPPHVFDKVASTMFDASAIKATCLCADDLWIKAMALLADVPVVLAAPNEDLVYVPGSQEEGLLYMNLDQGENEKQWDAISNYLIDKFGKDILTDCLIHSEKGTRLLGISAIAPYLFSEHVKAQETERLKKENEWLWSQVNSKAHKLGNALAKPIRLIKGKK